MSACSLFLFAYLSLPLSLSLSSLSFLLVSITYEVLPPSFALFAQRFPPTLPSISFHFALATLIMGTPEVLASLCVTIPFPYAKYCRELSTARHFNNPLQLEWICIFRVSTLHPPFSLLFEDRAGYRKHFHYRPIARDFNRDSVVSMVTVRLLCFRTTMNLLTCTYRRRNM